jgi:alpha-ketoglutarate-dependent taurine dioxygenase
VARFCDARSIEHHWLSRDTLRTTHVCQGVARHPQTNERVLFNQAHLFHVSNLGPESEQALVNLFGRDALPRHASFGDGGEIPRENLEAVRAAFRAEAITFQWQGGDVLLLDNMQFAHGRRPFTGKRVVLASLLEPQSA